MSSNVTIEPCEFTSVRSGVTSYGARIYDDEVAVYQNIWDSIPDDDLEVLRLVIQYADDATEALLDFVEENEKGIFIGGQWYEWGDIEGVFEEERAESEDPRTINPPSVYDFPEEAPGD